MDKFKIISILIIFILIDVVIGYYFYRFYRTPVTVDFVKDQKTLLEQMVSGGPPQGGIPSIDDPHFESIASADQYLDDQGFGLILDRNHQARFYPFQLLVWHQILNDTVSAVPIVVAHDPLSGASMAFERVVNEEELTFGVSGNVLNSHLVMFDRQSGSLWSLLEGEAFSGEKIQQKLIPLQSIVASWTQFKQEFPNGRVLSRQTGFTRDYTHDPYRAYQTSHALWFPVQSSDARLESKSLVFGVHLNSNEIAFARVDVEEKKLIQDELSGESIIILWDEELTTARGYFRQRKDGTNRSFMKQKDSFIDEETGSIWNTKGECVSGILRGEKLTPIPLTQLYWFAWVATYPQTKLEIGSWK